MRKLMMFFLVAFFATLMVNHAAASGTENPKGIWEYKVPAAPYEYSAGKLILGETDGKATVTIKFMSGTELKAKNVKIEKETISFGVEIESNPVTFSGKLVDGKITGKVNSPEGLMDLTAEKKQ